MSLAEIESATKKYSEDYGKLTGKVSEMEEEISAVKRRFMPHIKRYADNVADSRSALTSAIVANPDSFVKPRTLTMFGIKVGMQKGKGKIEFQSDEKTIQLIRKNFPEKTDLFIETKEVPLKDVITSTLNAQEIKKLGVSITEATDAPLIKSAVKDIDKLVDALIKDSAKDTDSDSEAGSQLKDVA